MRGERGETKTQHRGVAHSTVSSTSAGLTFAFEKNRCENWFCLSTAFRLSSSDTWEHCETSMSRLLTRKVDKVRCLAGFQHWTHVHEVGGLHDMRGHLLRNLFGAAVGHKSFSNLAFEAEVVDELALRLDGDPEIARHVLTGGLPLRKQRAGVHQVELADGRWLVVLRVQLGADDVESGEELAEVIQHRLLVATCLVPQAGECIAVCHLSQHASQWGDVGDTVTSEWELLAERSPETGKNLVVNSR